MQNVAPVHATSAEEQEKHESARMHAIHDKVGEGTPGKVTNAEEQTHGNFARMYDILHQIGEGTHGKVFKARLRDGGEHDYVAMKRVCLNMQEGGVPADALREISIMKTCNHANILRLLAVDISKEYIHLVFPLCDVDLRTFLKGRGAFDRDLIRSATVQCFRGVDYCHRRCIIHRDLKPQNVLVDERQNRFVIADFGLARLFSLPHKVYTHEVVTLWYRAPEVLLGSEKYGTPVDVWSLGCIVAEIATARPLFPGDSEIDTLFRIFRQLGTPNENTWPGVGKLRDFSTRFPSWPSTQLEQVRFLAEGNGFGDDGMALLQSCLRYVEAERPSTRAALRSAAFLQGV